MKTSYIEEKEIKILYPNETEKNENILDFSLFPEIFEKYNLKKLYESACKCKVP